MHCPASEIKNELIKKRKREKAPSCFHTKGQNSIIKIDYGYLCQGRLTLATIYFKRDRFFLSS